MRVSMRFAVIIMLIAMGMTTLSLSATGPAAAQVAKRYVLVGAGNSLPINFEGLVASVGGQVVYQLDEIGVAVVESADPGFAYASASLPGVQGVAEDRTVPLALPEQGDTTIAESLDAESLDTEAAVAEGGNPALARFFFAQWNLRSIGASAAWDAGFKGDPRVKVAVIDTGIDYGHQDLAGQVDTTLSKSFFTESVPKGIAPFMDMNGHGTHVAGLIAGKGINMAGVAPQVRLIAVKVAGRSGFAQFGTIVTAIKYAADAGADVINMSFGDCLAKNGRVNPSDPLFGSCIANGARENAQLMAALNRAVNYAHDKGALIVASAGNSGIDWDRSGNVMKLPAQLPHVAAVSGTGPQFGVNFDAMGVVPINGAEDVYTDHGMSIVTFASPGGSVTPFKLPNGMPGDRILSACSRAVAGCASGKAVLFMVGTSMAAAHVSGVAALVDSAAGGTLTGDQIMEILMQSADDFGKPGKDEWYGFGRINAYRAVTGK